MKASTMKKVGQIVVGLEKYSRRIGKICVLDVLPQATSKQLRGKLSCPNY